MYVHLSGFPTWSMLVTQVVTAKSRPRVVGGNHRTTNLLYIATFSSSVTVRGMGEMHSVIDADHYIVLSTIVCFLAMGFRRGWYIVPSLCCSVS